MAVRNFWATMNVDGKKQISTGPESKDGGMTINLFVRDEGESRHVVTLECSAEDGELTILVDTIDGEEISVLKFKR